MDTRPRPTRRHGRRHKLFLIVIATVTVFALLIPSGSGIAAPSPVAAIVDVDNDGIDDAYEDELIRRFAPIVKLHPDDEYRPSSVDWFLTQGTTLRFNRKKNCPDREHIAPYQILTGANLLSRTDHQTSLAWPFCNNSGGQQSSGPGIERTDFFIQIANDANEKTTRLGNLPEAPAYAHVVRAGGLDAFFVSYWFFYPYNGNLGLGFGAHEGDWERIQMLVMEGGRSVAGVYFSAHHGEGKWYLPGQYQTVEGRPVVYSAWHSHASYPWGGKWVRGWKDGINLPDDKACVDPLCVTWDTLGTPGTPAVVNIGEKLGPMPGMEWIGYTGRWGEIGLNFSGPFTPHLNAPPGPLPPLPPKCAGEWATQWGTAGADIIRGTTGEDVIVAFSGNDTIYGRGGGDLICAGGGKDLVYAQAGPDVVYGQAGRDRIFGGTGADVIRGGSGKDLIDGQRGNDVIYGGTHADTLRGRSGADELYGNAGPDMIGGGGGSPDVCRGGTGDDVDLGGCEVRVSIP